MLEAGHVDPTDKNLATKVTKLDDKERLNGAEYLKVGDKTKLPLLFNLQFKIGSLI